jgi:hypothetical protein
MSGSSCSFGNPVMWCIFSNFWGVRAQRQFLCESCAANISVQNFLPPNRVQHKTWLEKQIKLGLVRHRPSKKLFNNFRVFIVPGWCNAENFENRQVETFLLCHGNKFRVFEVKICHHKFWVKRRRSIELFPKLDQSLNETFLYFLSRVLETTNINGSQNDPYQPLASNSFR